MKNVAFPLFTARLARLAVGAAICVAVWCSMGFGVEPVAVAAEPPKLGLPIDCHMGKSCWVVNLVDLDAGPDTRDYRCTSHTYDGHKGVDIAVRDLAAMERGVAVLASAAGVVKAMRDGMPDRVPDATFRQTKKNLYCGNGIVVSHDGGWETQYCHMRRGSVTVKRGDKVTRGQKIGLVGHSGMAEFPHVHLSVRHMGRVVDPFLGPGRTAGNSPAACGPGADALWTKAASRVLAAPMTAVFNAGFAPEQPKPRAIRKGLYQAKALSRRSPVLVFWAEAWWVHAGDRLEIRIAGPDGATIVEHANILPKQQALRMAFAGRRKPGLFWPAGSYVGTARLSRTEAGKIRHFDLRREIVMRD